MKAAGLCWPNPEVIIGKFAFNVKVNLGNSAVKSLFG